MERSALIIGVLGGVGSATAMRLLADGWDVSGTVRSAEQVEEARVSVPGLREVAVVDLVDADTVGPSIAPLLAAMPALDAVVMAAARASWSAAALSFARKMSVASAPAGIENGHVSSYAPAGISVHCSHGTT